MEKETRHPGDEKNLRKTILLVEDEPIIALGEKMSLEANGYRVVVTHTGEKAVALAREVSPDLILMDIDLGRGMDGTEAAELILREKEMPLVFLSSHTEPDVVAKTDGITSYGYIVKNSGETVLFASIKMAFRLFEAETKERESKKALAHSHQLMQYIIEHDRSAVAVYDRDMRYVYVSQSYVRNFHLKDSCLIGKNVEEFFPQVSEKWREVHRRALAGEISSAEDDPHVRDDGVVEWTRWECRPWYDSDGAIGGVVVYTEFITPKKHVEEALRQSEERYRMLAEEMPVMVCSFLPDFTLTYVNKAYGAYFQRNPEELVGWRFLDILPEGDARQVCLGLASLTPENPCLFSEHGVERHGELRRQEWIDRAFFDSQGGITHYQAVGWDITDRRRAEEALRESEERYAALVHCAPLGIALFDAASTVLYANGAFASMLRADSENLIGRCYLDFVHPDDRAESQQRVASTTGGRSAPAREIRLVSASGEEIFAEVSAAPVEEKGRLLVLGVFHDISGRKRAEEQVRNLLEEKDLMLREVHHRIKNFMSTMGSLLFLHAQNLEDPRAVHALEDAQSRLESMAVLYDKLYRSGSAQALSLRVYLPALVEGVVSLFPGAHRVRVVMELEDLVLPAHLLSSLGILVNELVTNAMKYAFVGRPEGTLQVIARRGAAENSVVLTVGDDGVGLPPDLDMAHPSGFGWRLVTILTQQIHGVVHVDRRNGTEISLAFPG